MDSDRFVKWSEKQDPTPWNKYTRLLAKTPLGTFSIEWGERKADSDFWVSLNGDYIASEVTLENAKSVVEDYLRNLLEDLRKFIEGEDGE